MHPLVASHRIPRDEPPILESDPPCVNQTVAPNRTYSDRQPQVRIVKPVRAQTSLGRDNTGMMTCRQAGGHRNTPWPTTTCTPEQGEHLLGMDRQHSIHSASQLI